MCAANTRSCWCWCWPGRGWCPRSKGWGQIETVGGRANDSSLAGGREVPAGSVLDITYRWMFDTDTHIREFELVQDRPDVIRPGSCPVPASARRRSRRR